MERSSTRALLHRWVDAGLLTEEQAARIEESEERAGNLNSPVRDLVPEALGYLGGVLVLVAVVLFSVRYWSDLGDGRRFGIVAGAAVLLFVGGHLVGRTVGRTVGRSAGGTRQSTAGTRLRSVLWFLSTAAVAGALGLFGAELLRLNENNSILLTAAGTAIYALALWSRERTVLQQIATFVAATATAGAALAELPITDQAWNSFAIGIAIWWVSASWVGLGSTTSSVAARVLGSVGMLVAALAGIEFLWGHLLGLTSVALLILAGLLTKQLAVLGIGAAGTLLLVPTTLLTYFPGTIAAPVAVLLVGAVLGGIGVYVARQRRAGSDRTNAAARGRATVGGTP